MEQYQRDSEKRRLVRHTVNSNIPAVFQPFDKHFQAILGEAITRKSSLGIVRAEKNGTVVLCNAAPTNGVR
jgi:hypothetical protein